MSYGHWAMTENVLSQQKGTEVELYGDFTVWHCIIMGMTMKFAHLCSSVHFRQLKTYQLKRFRHVMVLNTRINVFSGPNVQICSVIDALH